jgi:C4-dicarboxylate-binding protein DctP
MKRLVSSLAGVAILVLIGGMAGCDGKDAATTPTPTVETIQWRVSFGSTQDSPPGRIIQKFADLADEYTDGRLEVLPYPNAQLFPAAEGWPAMLTGGQDMFWDAGYFVGSDYPNMYVWFSLQGLWESAEHGEAVLKDGRVMETMTADLEGQFPVKVLGVHLRGTKLAYVTRNKEITSLKDLEGVRVTGHPGAVGVSPISQYAGLVEVPIAVEEQYISLVQGVVGAWQTGLSLLADQRAYEVGNHIYMLPGGYYIDLVAVSRDSWDALPTDIRTIIEDKVWPETYEFAMQSALDAEERDIELMRSEMETYHESTQTELAEIWEVGKANPMTKVMLLMIDPEIVEIVEELRPSRQQ